MIEVLDDGATHTCANIPGQFASAYKTRNISCMAGAIGSFVKIRMKRNAYLNLCEVEVFGIRGKAKRRQTTRIHHNNINKL